jgi:hypothetical protein
VSKSIPNQMSICEAIELILFLFCVVGFATGVYSTVVYILIRLVFTKKNQSTPNKQVEVPTVLKNNVLPQPVTTPLESFIPKESTQHIHHSYDDWAYYLLNGEVIKLTRGQGNGRNTIVQSKIEIEEKVKSIEQYTNWIFILTETNAIYAMCNDKKVKINLGHPIKDMFKGCLIANNGVAYHIGELGIDRLYPTLELASKAEVKLSSFQEIKIDIMTGDVWIINNTKGIMASRFNVAP